jgi:hypothetical protein
MPIKRGQILNLSIDRVNLSQNTYSLLQHVVKIFPCLRSLTLTNYERSEAFLDGRPWRNGREGEQGLRSSLVGGEKTIRYWGVGGGGGG